MDSAIAREDHIALVPKGHTILVQYRHIMPAHQDPITLAPQYRHIMLAHQDPITLAPQYHHIIPVLVVHIIRVQEYR